jgi:hypothetical protein
VQRVVATALALARQPPLISGGEPGTWIVGALTGSWSRATIGLEHPAPPHAPRPITFDHELASGSTDFVLAHLGHPLVRMALGLMRAELWGTGHHLHRVTLRSADQALGAPVAVAHGRLVITGRSGHRLHEQVIAGAVRLGEPRPERLGVGETEAALSSAGDAPIPLSLRERCARLLGDVAEPLRAALQARAGDRARQLTTTLAARAEQESDYVAATLQELEATIRRQTEREYDGQLQLVTDVELDAAGDRAQVERDMRSLRARLDRIPQEILREQAAIDRRYADPTHRLFPAAVTLLVPQGTRL